MTWFHRVGLFCLAVILFGCGVSTPSKQRYTVMTLGALRHTQCTAGNLKISQARLSKTVVDCSDSNHLVVTYVVTCEQRTWICRQSDTTDPVTECVETAKVKATTAERVEKP